MDGKRTVRVVVVVVGLMGVLGGCGPAASPVPSPTAAAPLPSPTVPSSAPTAASPSESAGRTFPPSQTAIEPGTYVWTGFQPPITLRVDAGWEVGHRHPEFFDLFRGSDFPAISFGRFDEVYTDATTTIAATDAQAVVAALRARSDLTLADVHPLEFGGLRGQGFDLTSTAEQAPLFRGSTGSLKMDPGFENRYRLLDVPGGGVMLVGINAREGGLDAAVALAEPILASFALAP